MSETQEQPVRKGRPVGTKTTEHSTLVSRLRSHMEIPQEDFARLIGVREKTVRNYEKQSVIPKIGLVREAIEKLAKKQGVPLDES